MQVKKLKKIWRIISLPLVVLPLICSSLLTTISCSDGWKEDKVVVAKPSITESAAGFAIDDKGFPLDLDKMKTNGDNEVVQAGRQVIFSYIGLRANDFEIRQIPKEENNDVFTYQVTNNILTLEGSSPVAIARGFYEWVKSHGYGMVDWSYSNIFVPQNLGDEPKTTVISPYQHHFLYNTVTPGYTTPFFDEAQWTKQINWMAIHGYDISLAGVGTEAIYHQLLKEIGYSDKELNGYFAGPAYSPWQRMGNIQSWDHNPYKQDFDVQQIELQKHILSYMKKLEMIPIANGFAGFVPSDIDSKKQFRDLIEISDLNPLQPGITEKMGWNLPDAYSNFLLNPKTLQGKNAFQKLSALYVKIYQDTFGQEGNNYFLCDLFNEMAIPSPEEISAISEAIYLGLQESDPDAVWVSQGWGFSGQRYAWTKDKFAAYGDKVPDDKMVIISTAEDYALKIDQNEYNFEYYSELMKANNLPSRIGLNGKKWVFSTIPNMGGNTPFKGMIDFYAKGGVDALNSINKGDLWGFGTSPEGQENNQMIQEIVADAGWKDSIWNKPDGKYPGSDDWTIKKKDWLDNYALNRYKISDQQNPKQPPEAISKYLQILTEKESAFSASTRGPLFEWQRNPEPRSGTWNPSAFSDSNTAENDNLLAKSKQGFEIFLSYVVENQDLIMTKNPLDKSDPERFKYELFKQDVYEVATHYIGAELSDTVKKVRETNDAATLANLKVEMDAMFDELDRMLANHMTWNIKRWNQMAEHWGKTEEQVNYYRADAQRLVSIWDQGGSLLDYAGKTWAGLIKNWYKVRWDVYLESKLDSSVQILQPFQMNQLVEQNWGLNQDENWKYDYPTTIAKISAHLKSS